MDTKSALPSAQQERRDRMIAEENAKGNTSDGAVETTPPVTHTLPGIQHVESNVPATDVNTTKADISEIKPVDTQKPDNTETAIKTVDTDAVTRAEQAERAARLLELELAETRAALAGLTDAPEPSKARGDGASVVADAPQIETGDIQPTPEELEQFGEAESYIAKIARRESAAHANKAVEHLHARILALESGVQTVANSAIRAGDSSFLSEVKREIPNFSEIIANPKWGTEFAGKLVPVAGISYKEALGRAHAERNIGNIKAIFKAFENQYVAPTSTEQSGYAAVATTDIAVPADAGRKDSNKLPFSARKEASDNYIKGRISKAALEEIVEQYRKAEVSGNIDYDK